MNDRSVERERERERNSEGMKTKGQSRDTENFVTLLFFAFGLLFRGFQY